MTSALDKESGEVPEIDLENLDDLLMALTAKELEELNGDFDPDNTLLPPSLRSRNQTDKSPTGQFDRQKLLDFLEHKAQTERDWDESKPYVKEQKGVSFLQREPAKSAENKEIAGLETEWDEILKEASEEELVDLAAVLGFHSMLTQTQYHASLRDEKLEDGGFTGVARAEQFRAVLHEAPNSTEVEQSILQLKEDDQNLTTLNINNIKNVSVERLVELCEALQHNATCLHLCMANVAAGDVVGKKLAEALTVNRTLRTLNVESNFLSGGVIVELLKAINVNQSLLEFRVANQKPLVLGNRVEMEISKLVQQNTTLLRFGIALEFADARIRTHEHLKKNFDNLRKRRVNKTDK